MNLVPLTPAGLPSAPGVRASARTSALLAPPAELTQTQAAHTAIGAPRAAQSAPRFQFAQDARDLLKMERWHNEWTEARRSLVTTAYTALHRRRAGTLFDLAA